jgi:hypothetical protein
MRPEIQRAALRAAARLAFFSTVLGCGGLTDVATTEPDADPTDVEGRPGRALADASPDASVPPSAPDAATREGEEDAARADATAPLLCDGQASFACCEQEVHAAWPDGGGIGADAGAETTACCQVLADHYDEAVHVDGGDPNAWTWADDSNVKWACCEAINWRTGTCTPWGPPVPPPMKRLAVS